MSSYNTSRGVRAVNTTIVGVLFIVATAAGVAAAALINPVMNAPDYLIRFAAAEKKMIVGSFLQFVMAISVAGIGVGLYPIIKNLSAGLAIGTVGFRLLESTTQILGAAATVSLLVLSREVVNAGPPTAEHYQTFATVIRAGHEWMGSGVGLICWCIGAAMYYTAFYRYRLVPRWLSAWGLVGITLTVTAGVLVMLTVIPAFGTLQVAANLPIALQEMVFAVWLIAKGVSAAGEEA